MVITPTALFDHTDEQLRQFVRDNAPHIALSQNDIMQELDRRAARRQALASFALSTVGVLIALAALFVTAVKG